MLFHVISIPFMALHSTHTAFQLPQSPMPPCRRNISFPANSYPLKSRKFHLLNCFYRLRRVVKSYIEDADPEAALSVGADMRKINYCFQLLKVC